MAISGEMDILGEKDCIELMNINEVTFFTGIGENLKKQAARLPTLSFHQIMFTNSGETAGIYTITCHNKIKFTKT